MPPDARAADRFLACAGPALDRCRAALANRPAPARSWTKQNVFGRAESASDADLAVETILTAAFASADPGLPVIAEERRPSLVIPRRCVLIDPIDGTIPFLDRSPLFTTTACLVCGSRPACAVVDFPALGIRVQARPGRGLHIAGDITALPSFSPGTVLTSPAQMPGMRAAGRAAGFRAVEAVPATSVKMLLVALGRADAAVRASAGTASVAPWDYAAPALIASETGAAVRDDLGRDLARIAPVPVDGWVACRRPGLAAPLRQVMNHQKQKRDRDGI